MFGSRLSGGKFKIGLGVVLGVLVPVSLGAFAYANGAGGATGQDSNAPHSAQAAVNDSHQEAKTVPIAPCRAVDTRYSGAQKIAAGATRNFNTRGNLSGTGQGAGNAGGGANCGIPDGAIAIMATITALPDSGIGVLKAYAQGSAEPATAFMSSTTTFPAAVGGLVKTNTANGQFTLKNFNTPSQYVVDVTGYLIRPIWAHVNPDGTLAAGSHALSSAQTGGPGIYSVTFDRDVSTCGIQASVGATSAAGVIYHQPSGSTVLIGTHNSANTFNFVAQDFWVSVDC
ncbi:MAG: hypothetical protein ACJ71Z_11490 [Aeromicrobium sp.]